MGAPSREVRLKRRPVGLPVAEDFEIATVAAPAPQAGEVTVRNLWMSVDPYMRGRMSDRKSYVPPFALGEVMQGGAVGEVTASNDPSLKPGDLVESMYGWREAFTAPAAAVQKLPDIKVPPQAYLGVLGMPGLTAYTGLITLCAPKAGETVFVSGAAGAVGSIVVQIAKLKGCRVIASAGSDDKVAWVKRLGADFVVNYKTAGSLTKALAAGAPDGVDAYFDNVGGDHLEAALDLANTKARFALCGMIAGYNNTEPAPGPRNMFLAVGKQIRMEGFIVTSFWDQRPAFLKDMEAWIGEGKISWEETVEHGIENAPKAFLNLFTGANTGKMLVKLG